MKQMMVVNSRGTTVVVDMTKMSSGHQAYLAERLIIEKKHEIFDLQEFANCCRIVQDALWNRARV